MGIWDGDTHSLVVAVHAAEAPSATLPTEVRVAVRSRPLSALEKKEESKNCVQLLDHGQIKLGDKEFTFDQAYDGASRQADIYTDTVQELVTTASVGIVEEEDQGIIPRAICQIFEEVADRQSKNPGTIYKILVSFIEIYNEEIKDLLDPNNRANGSKGARSNGSKGALPNGSKGKPISLCKGPNNSIQAVGVIEAHVEGYEAMFACLKRGSVCRSVGSTSMNSVSSRSHAIFTVTIKQSSDTAGRADGPASENADPNFAAGYTDKTTRSVITSKFHFVDLAGSEGFKKTPSAAGDRMKEGININTGLLVLGQVISALGDVTLKSVLPPYRDSKLTRLLQDSIGGNSKTLMIVTISPADQHVAESLNALRTLVLL
ncbi:P-loop containing nucleoside triphosphate hydrolase protein [Baffinella frigidus]|nr:P-loop containing nucleoside triphosphate hydrolase protein [Cryptophyta sp. CCMP2293]